MRRTTAVALCLCAAVTFTLFPLTGCQRENGAKTSQIKTIIATQKATSTSLYFSGDIKPINTTPVIAPADATITRLFFHYGQIVKKGAPLLTLESSQLETDYHTAFSDYIKAKQDYNTALADYQNNQLLWKAGVIPESTFTTAKNTLENSQLGLIQAQNKLAQAVKYGAVSAGALEKLSLSDIKQVQAILRQPYGKLTLRAPADGIALFPEASQTDGDGASKKLAVGSAVKADQMLVAIGDLSGIAIPIQVDETHINRIQSGMKVKITGAAFPGLSLSGTVVSVGAQAQTAPSGGDSRMVNFPALVEVRALSEAAKRTLHIGMTAQVEFNLPNPPAIMIPLGAVSQKNGTSVVETQDAAGHLKTIPVVTGHTTPTEVGILQGLKPGDRVVVP